MGREDLGQLCQILCCLYAFSWIAVLIFTPIFKLVGGRQAIYKKHLLIQTTMVWGLARSALGTLRVYCCDDGRWGGYADRRLGSLEEASAVVSCVVDTVLYQYVSCPAVCHRRWYPGK